MFGEPQWRVAEPELPPGIRHAVALGEHYTACERPLDGLVVLAWLAWSDGAYGPKGEPCGECLAIAE
ncbi:MAG TPA: hypothetical protein VGI86_21100 [Acidimicrobiia bacterium]|jgi:hypothetical protein